MCVSLSVGFTVVLSPYLQTVFLHVYRSPSPPYPLSSLIDIWLLVEIGVLCRCSYSIGRRVALLSGPNRSLDAETGHRKSPFNRLWFRFQWLNSIPLFFFLPLCVCACLFAYLSANLFGFLLRPTHRS